MSHLRWAKFFWADWSNDTALNLCSLPARGLWMALLCIAAQGDPYGTVNIKGRTPSEDELFNLVAPRGTRRRDFNLWLAELDRNGVTQRDQLLTIRSPRMSQEGVTSLARIDAAKESWKSPKVRRSSRDLHVQTDDARDVLHMQEGNFAYARIQKQTPEEESPPVPPRGARRAARPILNGFSKSILTDMEANHDDRPEPAARGATVVPIARRPVRG
jgi:hypothetical protein